MQDPEYWKRNYVIATDPSEIERAMAITTFASGGERFELLHFPSGPDAPTVLVSQGSGGHAYVFAELAYRIHLGGYNVFVMPKHGGATVDALVTRHLDALAHIRTAFSRDVAIYAEGLGGYVAFYLALAHAPIVSVACENAPAIMTEPAYHRALLTDRGPWSGAARRRRLILPIARRLVRLVPSIPIPISSYLDWRALVEPGDEIEARLVDGYMHDLGFDRSYPLSAVMSLLSTPPSAPLDQLSTPTLFLIARRGPTPEYIRHFFARLPAIPKKAVDIDGGVYWMLSHPREAADILCDWFATARTGGQEAAVAV